MNYYAQAIEICSIDQNWKAIVIEIAKNNPSAVVNALNGQGWQVECRELMIAGEKIQAIKACRSVTGMSLKEAKAAVEALPIGPK